MIFSKWYSGKQSKSDLPAQFLVSDLTITVCLLSGDDLPRKRSDCDFIAFSIFKTCVLNYSCNAWDRLFIIFFQILVFIYSKLSSLIDLFSLQFELTGAVLSLDGSQCLKETISADITIPPEEPGNFIVTDSMVLINAAFEEAVLAAEEIGSKVAETLKQQGAREILEQAREAIAVAQNDLRLPKSK